MTWRLFLDDERDIAVIDDMDNWYVARSFNDACALVNKMGVPLSIDFDHDLGEGKNGSDFAGWLIWHMLTNNLTFPEGFEYYVHSQNPIGAANIRSKMDAAIKHFENE
jgi:hypothetical protein